MTKRVIGILLSLQVSFDGINTLHIAGNIDGEDDCLIRSQLPGLVISIDKPSYLACTNQPCLMLLADATITGEGKLTLASPHCVGIEVGNGAVLTLEELTLNIRAEYPISAGEDPSTAESLVIIHSYVHTLASEAAICSFGGGITLIDCELKTPEGGDIADGEVIDGEGWQAKEAHIAPIKNPDDPFIPYNGKIGDLDGDRGITASDARLALRIAVELEPELSADRLIMRLADVDGSGAVNAADARLILRRAVGFIDPEWIGAE